MPLYWKWPIKQTLLSMRMLAGNCEAGQSSLRRIIRETLVEMTPKTRRNCTSTSRRPYFNERAKKVMMKA